MGAPVVSSRDLVEQIWNEVADARSSRAAFDMRAPAQFEALAVDEERTYINARCEFDTGPAELPAAGPLKGLKARVKQRAGHFVVSVLERYFTDEKHFVAHLVRLQNKLTADHDRMADELGALNEALRIESERLRNTSGVLHARLEQRILELEDQLSHGLPLTKVEAL